MHYQEFPSGSVLQPYMQCFFTCEAGMAVVAEDSVFANGFVEIMFNLGEDGPEQIENSGLMREPKVQLWGQTISPFTFTSFRKHAMLGIRFFPHTAACFFNEPMSLFNDQVIDLHDVGGREISMLYAQLLEIDSLRKKIELVERFLITRIILFEHRFGKLQMVSSILRDMTRDDFFENINSIAGRYGISSRYLHIS